MNLAQKLFCQKQKDKSIAKSLLTSWRNSMPSLHQGQSNWLEVKIFTQAASKPAVKLQWVCIDNAFPKWEWKQCRDVTSRGVSGRLMRQFFDSSGAPETVRKPPPSANCHLVMFIWQLRVTECPASFCVTGRERINSLLASMRHSVSSLLP